MTYRATIEHKNRTIANICYGHRLAVCSLASDKKSMEDSSTAVVWKETVGEAWGCIIQVRNGNVNAARYGDDVLRHFVVPAMCRQTSPNVDIFAWQCTSQYRLFD